MHYPKLTVTCGVEYTVSLFFNDVSKISIVNQIISVHKMIYNILFLVYITSLIPYLNLNINSFTIETLVFLAEMRLEWLGISWQCTETCRCGKFFMPLYFLQSSSVFLPITNWTNQLGIFMTTSHGKGAMYFSRFFFLVLEFFAWQIVIVQELTKFINI